MNDLPKFVHVYTVSQLISNRATSTLTRAFMVVVGGIHVDHLFVRECWSIVETSDLRF